MALKSFVTSLDAVPDGLKTEYTQTEGGYTLNVDNSDFNQKIGEFRTNNIQYKKDAEDATAKLAAFNGVDPAKYAELIQKEQENADKKMIDAGKIDELVEQKVEKMKLDYETRFTAQGEALDKEKSGHEAAKTELNRRTVSDAVTKEALKRGNLNKGALTDVLTRAQFGEITWKVNENGVPTAYKADGQLAYGKDAKAPLEMAEWIADLSNQAPHLWQGNSGGGAGGSKFNSSGVRTITKEQAQSGKFMADLASGKVVSAI